MGKSDRFPWQGVDDLVDDLDRLLDTTAMQVREPGRRPDPRGFWTPVADVLETRDAYIIETELPGVRRGDIVLELRESELWVYGARGTKKDIQGGAFQVMERSHGPFARKFVLPVGVDDDRIMAVFGNGLLTVTLPKKESVLEGRVRIEISGG